MTKEEVEKTGAAQGPLTPREQFAVDGMRATGYAGTELYSDVEKFQLLLCEMGEIEEKRAFEAGRPFSEEVLDKIERGFALLKVFHLQLMPAAYALESPHPEVIKSYIADFLKLPPTVRPNGNAESTEPLVWRAIKENVGLIAAAKKPEAYIRTIAERSISDIGEEEDAESMRSRKAGLARVDMPEDHGPGADVQLSIIREAAEPVWTCTAKTIEALAARLQGDTELLAYFEHKCKGLERPEIAKLEGWDTKKGKAVEQRWIRAQRILCEIELVWQEAKKGCDASSTVFLERFFAAGPIWSHKTPNELKTSEK